MVGGGRQALALRPRHRSCGDGGLWALGRRCEGPAGHACCVDVALAVRGPARCARHAGGAVARARPHGRPRCRRVASG
eukprot:7369758-Alexandrium_andersonii.AAC.1